ncbi:hypothetical protein FHR22_002238 [Sphingopyxis panaciterrae]|uniref:phosphotransferase n=1 Tax=Sphingopyxis panaciterrae TaxID=363841 RepID=UPI0014207342|nr:phosphotransferase [Sphingopyxis panaciterrae]NIJ37554.1 hypothetical protein [Sphingopyxis panaciterrae]
MAKLVQGLAVESGNLGHSAAAGMKYDVAEAEKLWLTQYGSAARAEKIASELDAVFRVKEVRDGREYLLRIGDNRAGIADLQVAVLDHIAASAPGLPVARVHKSSAASAVIPLPSGQDGRYAAFATTFLSGKPLAALRSLSQRNELFELLAKLDRSLDGFSHPGARRSLLWDVSRADQVALMTKAIPSAGLRNLADSALEDWRALAAPRLGALRRQVIHNDFNPSNILAAQDGAITGIIDFGDVIDAPLICDLATAIAYQEPQHGFDTLLATAVAAYGRDLPLLEEEIAILPILVRARAAMVVAITHWRAAQNPGNRAYLLRNAPLASRLLESATQRRGGAFASL